MISEDKILKMLHQYIKTPAGKRQLKEYIKANSLTVAEMTEMVSALMDMIKKRLPDSIAQVGNTLKSTPPKKVDGGYEVQIQFDKSALRRDSLGNDLGYDGIDNIVALFNNGYHARNYVYGWWNSHKSAIGDTYAWVQSKKEREPLRFMQDAVAEFNATYGAKYGIVVELGSDYTAH